MFDLLLIAASEFSDLLHKGLLTTSPTGKEWTLAPGGVLGEAR